MLGLYTYKAYRRFSGTCAENINEERWIVLFCWLGCGGGGDVGRSEMEV